jgi:hypothetical protein
MIRQICSDYSGLPDIKTMDLSDIFYYYVPLIPSLIEAQKQMKRSNKLNG